MREKLTTPDDLYRTIDEHLPDPEEVSLADLRGVVAAAQMAHPDLPRRLILMAVSRAALRAADECDDAVISRADEAVEGLYRVEGLTPPTVVHNTMIERLDSLGEITVTGLSAVIEHVCSVHPDVSTTEAAGLVHVHVSALSMREYTEVLTELHRRYP